MAKLIRAIKDKEIVGVIGFLAALLGIITYFTYHELVEGKYTHHIVAESYGLVLGGFLDVLIVNVIIKQYEKRKANEDHITRLKLLARNPSNYARFEALYSLHSLIRGSVPNIHLEEISLADSKLHPNAATQISLRDCKFSNISIYGLRVTNSRWEGSSLSNCLLTDIKRTAQKDTTTEVNNKYIKTTFSGCRYTGGRVLNVSFEDCAFIDCTFDEVRSASVVFKNCTFKNPVFIESDGIASAAASPGNTIN